MRHLPSLFVVAAIALTGCGADNTTTTQTAAAPSTTTESATPSAQSSSAAASASAVATNTIVPDVAVVDVTTGTSASLRALIATDKPTLIWMWAPH